MDFAKIIGELKLELQCFDAAIAAVEQLAQVQKVANSVGRPQLSSAPAPASPDAPAVKRPRGRPRKNMIDANEAPVVPLPSTDEAVG